VPSVEAGQSLLNAIRRRNIIPEVRVQRKAELIVVAECMLELFPGKAPTATPLFAIIAIALKPMKDSSAAAVSAAEKILTDNSKLLELHVPPMLKRGDILKGLCRNPHAACRDLLQHVALPLARWARADDRLLKTLRNVRADYGLYMDHKRDVEGFLVAQQGRLPKINKTDALVATAVNVAHRIHALYRMRDLWTSRIERQFAERGIATGMDVSAIVFNMFFHTVLAALSPITRSAGPLLDFLNGAIDTWQLWGQRIQLSTVGDVLLRHAEAEKDMLLREYESRDEDDKRILGVQKRLQIGRFEAGDVKRMDLTVYKRDAALAGRLQKDVERAVAR
jgi:hypothetical protein